MLDVVNNTVSGEPVEAVRQRSYGFLISRVQGRLGVVSIVARVVARDGDSGHPINPSSDGERSDYRRLVPKRASGLMLDDLVIRCFQSSDRHNGRFSVYEPEVLFSSGYSLTSRKVEAMARTLKRVNAAITAAHASEAGDVLMAVASAIGAQWFARPCGQWSGGSYSDAQWWFESVPAGRDYFRRLIEAARDA